MDGPELRRKCGRPRRRNISRASIGFARGDLTDASVHTAAFTRRLAKGARGQSNKAASGRENKGIIRLFFQSNMLPVYFQTGH